MMDSRFPEAVSFTWADDVDKREVLYYTDAYFTLPSIIYQPSLATTSLCMAMAAGGSHRLGNPPDYTRQSQNGKALFQALGFCAPAENDEFCHPPEADSIGCVAAYKLVDDGMDGKIPLVALGLRGCNYTREWASNLTIGAAGDHAGFDLASDKALAFVRAYIVGRDELAGYDRIKFWIAGFSRAAATANLAAAKLVRDAADHAQDADPAHWRLGKMLVREDIYAYTFETPAGATDENRLSRRYNYSAIYNIINPDDIVPMVAPSCFGFGRYGTDCILPGNVNHASYAAYRDTMRRFYGESDYPPDRFVPCRWDGICLKPDKSAVFSQGVQFDRAITCLGLNVVGTRDAMVKKYQTALRNILSRHVQGDAMGADTQQANRAVLARLCRENGGELFAQLEKGETEKTAAMLFGLMQSEQIKDGTNADDALSLGCNPKDLLAVAELLERAYKADAGMVGTLALDQLQAGCISRTHYMQVALAWMRTMDPWYDPSALDPDLVFLAGEYRILRVHGDAAVAVAQNGRPVCAVPAPGGSQDNLAECGNTLPACRGKSGDILIGLPANGGYTVRLTTENTPTSVEYTVSEYVPAVPAISADNAHCVRHVAFRNIVLGAHKTLTGTIPCFTPADAAHGLPNGSNYPYTLCGPDGEITPAEDKRGQP